MEEKVSLSKLMEEGFVFIDFGELPEDIFNKIRNLPYTDACLPKGEQSRYQCSIDPEKYPEIYEYFINKWWEAVKDDPFLSSLTPFMKVGIDKCVKGDWIMPHTDIAISGVGQAACFYNHDGTTNFVGREFLYGTEDEFNTFRPDNRTACFIETTNEKFVHACRELESDSPFYAVGIYPVAPGGRNELLIPRSDLIDKWGVRAKKS